MKGAELLLGLLLLGGDEGQEALIEQVTNNPRRHIDEM